MSQEKQKNSNEKKSLDQSIGAFIQKFRFLILGVVLACVVIAVAFGVIVTVKESKTEKGLTETDAISNELSKARSTLKDAELKTKENDLYARAETAAKTAETKVTAVRSYMLMAEIQFSRSEWSLARDAWLSAAKADEKSYTYALCYYQAGICSEELKDYENAVSYLKIASESESFPMKQRAMFNIGRMQEQSGDTEKAVASYEALVSKYPSDQWASLAKTRLLTLSIKK